MKAVRCAVSALLFSSVTYANPSVVDLKRNVTYNGMDRNGIEIFLNIKYGDTTSGENRFKPPRPHVPAPGSTIGAVNYGPACPQALGPWFIPITLSNITHISEDCLNLNVARPKGTCAGDKLPVLVWIHGGSFWTGQNGEITTSPDELILQSIENNLPVMHVAMNSRLGFFGFAQSEALKTEGSENAGLRDQRLAITWVRENIAQFGGDPEKITIFGQSSGGLAVGMQIMAYGASKPVPFHQAICESQALEPGITGNFTIDAMKAVVDYVGCNTSSLNSVQTVDCLRKSDMETLLNASLTTYQSDITHNIGDIWLPVVDGDFLPAAPSQLVKDGRFANVTTMIGWANNDVAFFTDFTIRSPNDTYNFISGYLPDMTPTNVHDLLALYPVTEFPADLAANLSSEFFRTARIFRDIIMTCQPIFYAEHIANRGNKVFLYDWNQTILDPIIESLYGQAGLGPVHTSEFAYIFGLSHYNTSGYPFAPSAADYALQNRGSRSWSTYASIGHPSLKGHDTFHGFKPAFGKDDQIRIFVVGGPHEGLSAVDGPQATAEMSAQRLRERCSFINSDEIIEKLRY